MVSLIDEWVESGVAIVGAGGAGDVVSAYVACRVLDDLFGVRDCVPVAVLWERWILDPCPGPIPRALIRGASTEGPCVMVNGDTEVTRCGRSFRPQASAVAGLLGSTVPGITLEFGAAGIRECLNHLMTRYGSVLLLDVGGDILAEGWEEGLWSPLTDSLVLAAAANLPNTYVGIIAPGADGELPASYVLDRMALAARLGGFLGSIGLWRDHVSIYEEVLPLTHTEAGRAAYRALKGLIGYEGMRDGTRRAPAEPYSPIIYVFTAESILRINKLAQNLTNTRSLAEAAKKAEELGISTELHLETWIAKNVGCLKQPKPHHWKQAKQHLRTRNNDNRPGGQSSGVG